MPTACAATRMEEKAEREAQKAAAERAETTDARAERRLDSAAFGLDQPHLSAQRDGVGAALRAQLGDQVVDVGLDRALGQDEFFGHFAV